MHCIGYGATICKLVTFLLIPHICLIEMLSLNIHWQTMNRMGFKQPSHTIKLYRMHRRWWIQHRPIKHPFMATLNGYAPPTVILNCQHNCLGTIVCSERRDLPNRSYTPNKGPIQHNFLIKK